MTVINRLSWISLSKLETTFVFASTHSLPFGGARWDWIERTVRDEFECYVDDVVDSIEDEDGRELVTLNGEPVVEVHNAKLTGYVAGLVREAA